MALPLHAERGADALTLYVCGVTPYDTGHVGHAFTFCAFDVLVRFAESRGVRVRYVQNVTDVDDPLFERARRDGVGWGELAEAEQDRFVREMDILGWRRPDLMPKVSDEIPTILGAVRELKTGGSAYETGPGAVYFEASRYRGYGELSGRSRRSMLRKLRDEDLLGPVGPGRKRDPLDFPLWRPSAADEPAWESEFGAGRPGWHIECSAMAIRHLGPQIDIHGGGRDLRFSHHESERAQSESLTGAAPFARAWMHTGMVRYEGRKMSKSLGNLVRVPEVLDRVPPAALRLYLASHRYRRDWSFSWTALERHASLVAAIAGLGIAGGAAGPVPAAFDAALADDLDSPAALRVLGAGVRRGDAEAVRAMLFVLAGTAATGPAGRRS